jgi:hypothetical protein
MNQDPQTIVVIPSMTLDPTEGAAVSMQPYEERYLFLLLLLRQPRARLIYVTSQPILPSVIDYYLDLLPSHPTTMTASHLPCAHGGPSPVAQTAPPAPADGAVVPDPRSRSGALGPLQHDRLGATCAGWEFRVRAGSCHFGLHQERLPRVVVRRRRRPSPASRTCEVSTTRERDRRLRGANHHEAGDRQAQWGYREGNV